MAAGEAKLTETLGFFTVVEHAPLGLFGGYLLLNLLGRPLEFHCTTPVKPSRAQEILYGPTLAPYLYGELIGQALVNKASHKPLAVLTDVPGALALRMHAAMPVALVEPEASADADGLDTGSAQAVWRHDGAHRGPAPALVRFRVGANALAVDPVYLADREQIAQRLQGLDPAFDLAEPFARIREAIEEAQRGGR